MSHVTVVHNQNQELTLVRCDHDYGVSWVVYDMVIGLGSTFMEINVNK